MKIMVCYDSAKTNTKVLELAKKHAKAFDAKVYVATVLTGSEGDQLDSIEESKGSLAAAEQFFQDEDIPVETKLMFGDQTAGEHLVDFARDGGMDEIIIGSGKKSKLGKLVFGSTSQYVILEGHCPVITTR
jgi:nucleotide-binding universal stress UspA family protein